MLPNGAPGSCSSGIHIAGRQTAISRNLPPKLPPCSRRYPSPPRARRGPAPIFACAVCKQVQPAAPRADGGYVVHCLKCAAIEPRPLLTRIAAKPY